MTIDNNNNNAEKVGTEICNPKTGEALAVTLPKQKEVTISITQQDIEDVRLAKEKLKLELDKLTKEVITRGNWRIAKHNARQCNRLMEEIERYAKSQLESPEGLLKSYKDEIKEMYRIIKEAKKHWKEQEDLVYLNEFYAVLKKLIQNKILKEYTLNNIEEEYQDITEADVEKLLLKTHGGFNIDDVFETMYLTKTCEEKILTLIQNCKNKKLKRQARWVEFDSAIKDANLQPEFAIDKEELNPFIDSDNFPAILQTAVNKAKAKQRASEERIARETKEAEEKIKREAERKINEARLKEEKEKQAKEKVEKEKAELERKLKEAEEKAKASVVVKNENLNTKQEVLVYQVFIKTTVEVNSTQELDKIRREYKSKGFDDVEFKLKEIKETK